MVIVASYIFVILRNLIIIVIIKTRIEIAVILSSRNYLILNIAKARIEVVVIIETNLRPRNYTTL